MNKFRVDYYPVFHKIYFHIRGDRLCPVCNRPLPNNGIAQIRGSEGEIFLCSKLCVTLYILQNM
jgi:hypothetical protein